MRLDTSSGRSNKATAKMAAGRDQTQDTYLLIQVHPFQAMTYDVQILYFQPVGEIRPVQAQRRQMPLNAKAGLTPTFGLHGQSQP